MWTTEYAPTRGAHDATWYSSEQTEAHTAGDMRALAGEGAKEQNSLFFR